MILINAQIKLFSTMTCFVSNPILESLIIPKYILGLIAVLVSYFKIRQFWSLYQILCLKYCDMIHFK